MSDFATLWTQDWILTFAVTAASIAAVWLPLTRGAALCWRARRATRPIVPGEFDGVAADSGPTPSLPRTLCEVYQQSERESGGQHPSAFIRDASKQLVVGEYEARFSQPISMYANILPPIGFIGTTLGLVMLFVSMRLSNDPLQMGALALALSSTIFALVGYAFLEGLKIHLYGRLLQCLEQAMRSLSVAGQEG